MTLDRVTELNIQLFMQLVGIPGRQPTSDMYWQSEKYEIWLNYREGRLHISHCLLLEPFDNNLLTLALHLWQPAYFAGIPQRLFQLRRGLVISCSPAVGSAAQLWFRIYQCQQAFLESLCKSPI